MSQLISALAPTFAVLALGRVLCAMTHGLMWSVIAPIGIRLVPADPRGSGHHGGLRRYRTGPGGRQPADRGLSALWAGDVAVVAITVAVVVVLVAARLTLPQMAATEAGQERRRSSAHAATGGC